jgi:hypothetical protein
MAPIPGLEAEGNLFHISSRDFCFSFYSFKKGKKGFTSRLGRKKKVMGTRRARHEALKTSSKRSAKKTKAQALHARDI